jgi:translation initiation factor 2 beta subunit (eIF-2beta)/eIF-5
MNRQEKENLHDYILTIVKFRVMSAIVVNQGDSNLLRNFIKIAHSLREDQEKFDYKNFRQKTINELKKVCPSINEVKNCLENITKES